MRSVRVNNMNLFVQPLSPDQSGYSALSVTAPTTDADSWNLIFLIRNGQALHVTMADDTEWYVETPTPNYARHNKSLYVGRKFRISDFEFLRAA